MLKIKRIEFIKAVYDESMSHQIFSIANITFTNYEPIQGALLYWQKNTDAKPFTKDGDYKFYYDMANETYFASVKFPKHVRLTRDQKQELAFILLEERGTVGSYSFATTPMRKKRFAIQKAFEKLQFPPAFQKEFLPVYVKSIVSQLDLQLIRHDFPYETSFIEAYAKWRYKAAQLHPNELAPYMDYIDFRVICALNPYLTENYLIEHLPEVNFEMIATNYQVLSRLSPHFLQVMFSQLEEETKIELQDLLDHEDDLEDEYLMPATYPEEESVPLEFFEYDRGPNKWQGGEHLVKGIPSFASQLYDAYGYKKKTNVEMKHLVSTFNPVQIDCMSASFEPHWISKFKDVVNWSIVCRYNAYLTDDFIEAHLRYIDFEALGQNEACTVSEAFLEQYMDRFDHSNPVPLVIRHLTESLYNAFKDTIILNNQLLVKYGEKIEDEEFLALQNLIDP